MNLSPRRREEPHLDITPLIDVVFLMLIFFMVSTTFLNEAALRILLPQSSEEPVRLNEAPVEVTINRRGQFFIDGEALVNSQVITVRRALKQALDGREAAEARVVIRADSRTEHGLVVTALDAAGQVGVRQVGIATVPRGQ